ncbi:DAGAT-domain-containing protein [Cutaneotrichosporon oleaginosum]|uniref:Diacylglycerol O-acyltransferase n=1 Tax=Cutaneotrichosporon oleaginosum TaxID=879819 RepID=A0A0J1BBH3_9TREE|nr:DAGAT-domain-containing protein [Cutaneotrichosporon oleaginosum]KLT45344.1 DAGAT-domain-containing protein [Cutaneotrichosporon oleaginosum]
MSTSASSASSSSSSPGTSPVTTHSALDSEPGTPSGLGLNVKLDTFGGRIRSVDGPSPAPSLITLHSSLPASPDPTTPSTEEGELEFSPDPAEDAPQMRQRKVPSPNMAMTTLANGAATQTLKKPQKKLSRHKSPLLDALKLPPLSEISIPRPVQIKFAPLHIPPHRRLQTFAILTWAILMPLCLMLYFYFLSIPGLWPVLVPYTIWALAIDKAPFKGGRPKRWARRFPLWKYFCQYYPCSMIKEADLPADRTYVFGYHPHGIISMGAVATFATEYTGFSENYPGIKSHLLTLDSNFGIPFYRELLMFQGICSVSKRSCRNILRKGPGNAITIVVGGAAESLAAHPGTQDLTLKKRFGFIKVAIREGAQLVPVFSFGENDVCHAAPRVDCPS